MTRKFKGIKIDFEKIGFGLMGAIQSNASTIAGGLSMIALALLCKKLNVPYQVLTDPFSTSCTVKPSASSTSTKLMLVPNNALEASMAAVYESAIKSDWDSSKTQSVNQIYSILSASQNDLSEGTKTYAITLLQGISDSTAWQSTKDSINRIIVKIGKGEF